MMKENDLQALMWENGLRAGIWVVVLLAGGFWSWVTISARYRSVGEADSVAHYILYCWLALAVVLLVTALWWISTTCCAGSVRRLVEENSFVCALVCILVVFAAVAVLFMRSCGIVDTNGNPQLDGYIFIFPALFGGLMYSLPPVNVAKVVWPFGVRLIPCAAMGAFLAAVVCFWT